MDERDLSTLFQAAPGDPPPPTFDLSDVTAASARARARRRSALVTAAACVVLALAGFGVSRIPFTGSSTSQVAGQAPAAAPHVPSPLQGSDRNGQAGPRAEGASGCDQVDSELATALAGELRGTGRGDAQPGRVCPTGSRSAAFRVVDGDRHGLVSVVLALPGSAVPLESGDAMAQAPAAGSGSIIVYSTPDLASDPPLLADLDRIARALAARF
ncbi:hypothetical protein [Amycolatopsis taiwanensis]|uniref:Uncharacterized protein n=1 Tax=Amycolatopsis taiwanensis TaxID=342230 RepID=A0A9W6R4K8_9PSEU|nr:hypothetical protein [Amycolatopsis taiwanensis]GLY67375.1 hypothetical protein Atai01_39940 [Amycolatopsis taiwanensis]